MSEGRPLPPGCIPKGSAGERAGSILPASMSLNTPDGSKGPSDQAMPLPTPSTMRTTALYRLPKLTCDLGDSPRSEEHTSELQSLMRNSYAVFCLKKKKKPLNNNK